MNKTLQIFYFIHLKLEKSSLDFVVA